MARLGLRAQPCQGLASFLRRHFLNVSSVARPVLRDLGGPQDTGLGSCPPGLEQQVTSEKECGNSVEVAPRVTGDGSGWSGQQKWAAEGVWWCLWLEVEPRMEFPKVENVRRKACVYGGRGSRSKCLEGGSRMAFESHRGWCSGLG